MNYCHKSAQVNVSADEINPESFPGSLLLDEELDAVAGGIEDPMAFFLDIGPFELDIPEFDLVVDL